MTLNLFLDKDFYHLGKLSPTLFHLFINKYINKLVLKYNIILSRTQGVLVDLCIPRQN